MSNDSLNYSGANCNSIPLEILVPGNMQILAGLQTVSGTAEPGAVVKVRVDNLPLQEVTAGLDGTWSITLPCPLKPGCHAVYAVSCQASDNADYSCFKIAIAIPLIPTPPSPDLLPAPVILYPAQGQEITDTLPVITGTALPGNMVIVCIRGMMCTRTMADGEGNFSAVFARELTPGTYTVTALQVNSCGERSELTEHTFSVVVV
ncbi:MAG: hypothetical protein LBS36_03640 [Oscillospiraceae bacterium]|jgi:hypothetical protein|nr:hypothetical protein [Oscillospiraceae bacterium]